MESYFVFWIENSVPEDELEAGLTFLYEKFGDLTLTLAAYNAGEGRVARAIKRAGNTHFPDLALPKETQQYVRRFYALMKLIDITKLHKTKKLRKERKHYKDVVAAVLCRIIISFLYVK